MRTSLAILPLLLVLTSFKYAYSGELEKIGLAIESGNSKELAKYFDNYVELTIAEDEKMYSKAQAELVLKDFFNKNRPTSFKIIHNGFSSQGSQYCIGTLVADKGTYRTYIYIKQKNGKDFIQEIRFEND